MTASKVPHRTLTENNGMRAPAVESLCKMLVQHHASPEALKRTEQHREAMKRLGLATEQARLRKQLLTSAISGEGVVLRFSGEGKVLICSRNRDESHTGYS
jgi:uncharacterized protein (AIM24 family)